VHKSLQVAKHNPNNWQNLVIITIFSVALLSACGGGGDNNPTVKQGTFIDSAVEGLSYVSGGQSGTTDASGAFSFEDGQTVRFSVGGIVIGEAKAEKVMTPVELVVGAEDETDGTVINIIRFLQTLDDDGDPSNGIRVPQSIRDLAEGKTVNFEGSEVEFEGEGFFTEIEVEHPLVSAVSAQAHLRGTLLKSMAGTYSGTYSGSDSGTWIFTLSESGAFTSGSGKSNSDGPFTVSTSGSSAASSGSFAIGGSTSTGATFTGKITRSGDVSGTWKNNAFGDTGSFSGKKTEDSVPPPPPGTVSLSGADTNKAGTKFTPLGFNKVDLPAENGVIPVMFTWREDLEGIENRTLNVVVVGGVITGVRFDFLNDNPFERGTYICKPENGGCAGVSTNASAKTVTLESVVLKPSDGTDSFAGNAQTQPLTLSGTVKILDQNTF